MRKHFFNILLPNVGQKGIYLGAFGALNKFALINHGLFLFEKTNTYTLWCNLLPEHPIKF